jgi:hypothetical protein
MGEWGGALLPAVQSGFLGQTFSLRGVDIAESLTNRTVGLPSSPVLLMLLAPTLLVDRRRSLDFKDEERFSPEVLLILKFCCRGEASDDCEAKKGCARWNGELGRLEDSLPLGSGSRNMPGGEVENYTINGRERRRKGAQNMLKRRQERRGRGGEVLCCDNG